MSVSALSVKELVKGTPIPAAGVALGLVSLGNLLELVGEGVRVSLAICAACLMALVVAKIILFPAMVREDMKNPVIAGTSGTFFMTLMQLASVAAPVAFAPSFALWCAAVLGHGALIVWFTATYIVHFDLKKVFTTYFVAYIGIAVAAVTSPAFGMESVGRVLFWFAFACYAVLIVVVTARYVKYEVPEAAKPTFCIYAAPASLSLTAYLTVAPNPNLVFVAALVVFAQAMLVMALTQLPKFLRLPFYPSYAAMTFPFVISATAFGRALLRFEAAGFAVPLTLDILSVVEIAIATVMVAYVFARYLAMLKGKLVVATAPAAEPQRFANDSAR